MEALRRSRSPSSGIWLSGVALVAVCGTSLYAGSPAKSTADPGAAEISAYRLSVATLHKIEQAIKNLDAMAAANPSMVGKLEQLQVTDPKDGSPLPLDKAVARVSAVPEFKKALAAAGLAPREYVVFSLALIGASFAQLAVLRDGRLPADAPPVLAENVKWLQLNRVEFERFQKEMDQLSAKYEKPEQTRPEEEQPEPEADPGL